MKKVFLLFFLHYFLIKNVNADINKEVSDLKNEFKQIKEIYESKIEALEAKIEKLEHEKSKHNEHASKEHGRVIMTNMKSHSEEGNFNIEAVLNGKYTSFSRSGEVAPKGFGTAHEGERGREGLQIGESELIMNSDIGEKFSGSLTAAIVREDGADKIELEEAYVESLEGSLLKTLSLNLVELFGMWNFNPHAHADDFADRPLPYRVFLNKAYNDDGLETSFLLSGSNELGFGIFRGEDFPFGNTAASEGHGSDAWSVFYKSSFNVSNSEELAFNALSSRGKSRSPNARSSNEDNVTFNGDSDLSIINLDYENIYTLIINLRLVLNIFTEIKMVRLQIVKSLQEMWLLMIMIADII